MKQHHNKRKSLPHNIASRTGWKIEQKKYNRDDDWILIEDNLNYDDTIQKQLQQRYLYDQEQHLKNLLYTSKSIHYIQTSNSPYPYQGEVCPFFILINNLY